MRNPKRWREDAQPPEPNHRKLLLTTAVIVALWALAIIASLSAELVGHRRSEAAAARASAAIAEWAAVREPKPQGVLITNADGSTWRLKPGRHMRLVYADTGTNLVIKGDGTAEGVHNGQPVTGTVEEVRLHPGAHVVE